VLHILNKDPSTASIPFVFITAKTDRSGLRKGMEMGADDYITKPFEDTDLLNSVETRLKKMAIINKETIDERIGHHSIFEISNGIPLINQLLENAPKEIYKTHDIIYRSGDFPHFVFYVVTGKVKVYRLNEDGKEFISDIYLPGNYFGFVSVIENCNYTENAEVMESGEIQRIPKDEFLDLLSKNNELAYKLIGLLSTKLTQKEEQLIHLAYDSVRKRVSNKLLEIISKENNTTNISRTDLASLVGTTAETLVRTLSELKELEIISTDGHEIKLLDKKKLLEHISAW
jgi:CRP-like cAMP-binding protein